MKRLAKFVTTPFRRWIIARAIRRELQAIERAKPAPAIHPALPTGLRISITSDGREIVLGTVETVAGPAGDRTLEPGRQPLRAAWHRPVPRDADSAPWEDLHSFPPGCRPKRDAYIGLHHVEPALAMICVGCELEQAPLTHGERTCAYCGLRLKLFGSRVFWWREPGPAVEEWRP